MTETIDRAAIRHRGDVFDVPRPGRHHNVIHKMNLCGLGAAHVHDQGFLTSSGRYVNRADALKIAEAAGQIVQKTGPPHLLFSEDMW
jgi:hypothetical protein